MSKRSRKRQDGHFAMLPEEVMSSAAWKSLTHSQRTTLTVLAVQFHGGYNGVQVLTRKKCEEYGVDHSQATRDAKVLVERGLIEKVYQARYKTGPQRRVPSLYALGWQAITHRNNWPLDQHEKAPNRWATWTPNENSTLRTTQQTAAQNAADDEPNCCVVHANPPKTAAQNANLLRSRLGVQEKDKAARRARSAA